MLSIEDVCAQKAQEKQEDSMVATDFKPSIDADGVDR
jgi:hypothetical protein